MTIVIRAIQLILITIPLATMGWLLNQWYVPSGLFAIEHEVGNTSPFIDALKPESRVEAPEKQPSGDMAQAIVSDPAFFFVHPHREDFAQVDLEVWFQNDSLPIVELGGLARVAPETYTLYPVHNRLIDESEWNRIDEDGVVLLQKEPTYRSFAEFFLDPPARDQVATYRTTFDVPYRIEGYSPRTQPTTTEVSLRGHHEFKTYIKDEPLDFLFQYMDMNREEGEDVLRATVFNEKGQPVAEARAGDDGNTSNDAIADYGLKALHLNAAGLPEGVYKVVVSTTRDVFIRTITTPQQKMVFLNAVFVGDEVGYREPWSGASLYTNAKRLRIQTRHAEGVQTVRAGDQQLNIEEPYQWYTLVPTGDGVERIDVPVGDVEVVTEGVIAFEASQFFNPDPVALNAYATIEQLGVDFVLARYTSPRVEGDWLVATIPFATDGLHQEDTGTWKFSFSTPLIDELGAKLWIHKMNLLFRKDAL